ncbi:MAG: hypothetical protein WBG37_19130, partial [Desulfobacterales bacterium]
MALSPKLLVFALMVFTVLGAGGGAALWHLNAKGLLFGHSTALEAKIKTQAEDIAEYQTQIRAFAGRIDELSARLGELDGLEHEVRTLASLETADTQEGVYSVGGLEPADSPSSTDLARDHRQLIRNMHARTRILEESIEQQRLDLEKLLNALGRQQDLLAATPSI